MAHNASHGHHAEGHVLPYRLYVTVLATLLILTIVTVAVAQVDFGPMNIVIAMLIASVKAGIVALFFMHLKYENPLIWLYVVFPILLIGLLLGGLFIDQPLRVEARGDRSPLVGAEGPSKKADHGGHAPQQSGTGH